MRLAQIPAAAAPQRRVDGDLRLICVHPMKIQFHYAAYHTGTSRFLSLLPHIITQKR